MSSIVVLVIAMIVASNLYAQETVWLLHAGGAGDDWAEDVIANDDGTATVVGTFSGEGDFGSVKLNAVAGKDFFVAEYDKNGKVIWAKSFGGDGDDEVKGVARDEAGNYYVTGCFTGTMTLGDQEYASTGTDAFVLKLDNNGQMLWSAHIGGEGEDYGYDIAVDAKGNSYIGGSYTGFLKAADKTLESKDGGSEAFVVSMNNEGQLNWASRFGGPNNDYIFSIDVDGEDNVYVAGKFMEWGLFDHVGQIERIEDERLESMGDYDAFIAKLSADGKLTWAQHIGGMRSELINDMKVSDIGEMYITGGFMSTVDMGNMRISSAKDFDAFVAKFDKEGQLAWVDEVNGGIGDEIGHSLAVDALGRVFVAGEFAKTAVATDKNLIGTGGQDMFIGKWDETGTLEWINSYGSSMDDRSFGMDADMDGDVIMTGQFYGRSDFNDVYLESFGEADSFIWKLTGHSQ